MHVLVSKVSIHNPKRICLTEVNQSCSFLFRRSLSKRPLQHGVFLPNLAFTSPKMTNSFLSLMCSINFLFVSKHRHLVHNQQ